MPLLAKLKKAFIPPDAKAQYAPPPGVRRTHVWMDVSIGDAPVGRIEMELFDEVVPRTAANFRALCDGRGQHGYKGSTFHRIVPGFMVQGGDIVHGDGTGVYSIYGGAFPDENFKMRHAIPGVLSMANSGPGTNGCQFFITVAPTEFLDGKHVVFGRVVSGMDVVKVVEHTPTGASDRPVQTRVRVRCGRLCRA
ncbi:hypothetical protein CC85DRAFT_308867 [Cutaneotrichosporon oleaginosum]|uniref:Peptidyl-prolyl cis-trans isomerase n=1 Tax=Cutaneotrichosporon oleaginosum TaxID=879819 RepID=A0A0J0XHS7_9TREE|nr:uncharacterized protein CC85DRAFT_308867 [Cutaneotrichosporon oleaginosum]KLT40675.1 hypothetical protein CC85DRAFT_308867 [Cutaneotrichosporon oleaginosum]